MKLHFPISTQLLVIAAAAIIVTWNQTRHEIRQLDTELANLDFLVHELRIDDPAKIAVVGKHAKRQDESRWEIYIPKVTKEGLEYSEGTAHFELGIALENLPNLSSETDRPHPLQTIPLSGGRHTLAVRQQSFATEDNGETHRVQLFVDEKMVFEANRRNEWKLDDRAIRTAGIRTSQSFDADRPVDIVRQHFANPRSDSDQRPAGGRLSSGIQLWIEPSASQPRG